MSQLTSDVVMIINDEVFLNDLAHLRVRLATIAFITSPPIKTPCNLRQDIHVACDTTTTRHGKQSSRNFGGLHFVVFGDLSQHNPVKGTPLWHIPKTTMDARKDLKNAQGRLLWTEFDNVVILEESFRFSKCESGRALRSMVSQLSTGRNADGSEVDYNDLANAINDRAIQIKDVPEFLHKAPRALVLRHDARPQLTRSLVLHHAAKLGVRVTSWVSSDHGNVQSTRSSTSTRRLSTEVLSFLENYSDNGLPATIQYFYEGIPYRFMDNSFPHIGWFKNGDCTGKTLVCDDAEPPDNFASQFRMLKHPPRFIVVEVPGRNFGQMCGETFKANHLPVEPKQFTHVVQLPHAMTVFQGDTSMTQEFKLTRTAPPIECVITFTDYYSQGISFKNNAHFLHLSITGRRPFNRGNLLVPLSRPSRLEDVVLLHPLWEPGDTQGRVNFVERLKKAIGPSAEADAERARFRRLYDSTIERRITTMAQKYDLDITDIRNKADMGYHSSEQYIHKQARPMNRPRDPIVKRTIPTTPEARRETTGGEPPLKSLKRTRHDIMPNTFVAVKTS